MKIHRKIFALVALALVFGLAHADVARQKTYAGAEEAFSDLVAALKSGKAAAMLAALGPKGMPLITSGDKVADRLDRERFLKAYGEASKIEKRGDAKAVLVVGKDEWSFPIPVVNDAGGWHFDAGVGSEEILNRRIGRNELYTIQAARAYVDAQQEYYQLNPQKSKLLQYAQRIGSSAGKRDGLYYPTAAGEPPSPLGPHYETAVTEGYRKGENEGAGTFHGYKYRVLKAQGPDATGGAYDYLVRGAMVGGFALVAWPVTYGNSGVMTFIVNHAGVVYEKDLGPATAVDVQKIKRFNPDKSWKRAAQ